MTPNDIIPRIRSILNDQDGVRWPDDELLRWINDALHALVDMRPDLFMERIQHTCVDGATQNIVDARLRKVVSVIRVVDGPALTVADRAALDAFFPTWYQATRATAQQWLPHETEGNFLLYPPAPAGQIVETSCVRSHPELTSASDTINLPENYLPAFVAYGVAMAESKDDEQINTGRAQSFIAAFGGMVNTQGAA